MMRWSGCRRRPRLQSPRTQTSLDLVREHCGIGRSRAYEYISIAEGKKTEDDVRASNCDRQRKFDEPRKASVTNRQDEGDDLRKSLYECMREYGPLTDQEMRNAGAPQAQRIDTTLRHQLEGEPTGPGRRFWPVGSSRELIRQAWFRIMHLAL